MLLSLLACTGDPPAPSVRDDLPNVVLISMDTLRADRLSAAGYPRDTTPFLDELAAAGVMFTNSYAQAPSTLPTHTSLFTSWYPQHHQVYGHHRLLEDKRLTLAEHLAASGYQTYASVSSMRFLPEIGINQGFEIFHPFWALHKSQRSTQVTDTLLAHAAQPSDKPLFAFLHYFDVHAPYNPPEPYLTRYHPLAPELVEPERTIAFLDDHRLDHVEPKTLAYLEALYDGGVAHLDAELRRLYEGFSPANGRPTVWIFTADHGEEFKEQGYLGHSQWMHREILAVPLIVVWSGRIEAGQKTDALAQSVDLFPTLLDLLEIPRPESPLSGRSLVGPLTGSDAPLAQPYPGFTDVLPLYENPRNWGVAATIDGQRFQLSKHEDQELALYRLDTDHTRDVIRQYQPQASALLSLAHQLKMPVTGERKLRKSGRRQTDMEELEMLRSMGYVDEIEGAARDE